MSQGSLVLFSAVCGEQYSFERAWGQLRPDLDWSPLFCALTPSHDGRHIDQRTGIPWDRPEDIDDEELVSE